MMKLLNRDLVQFLSALTLDTRLINNLLTDLDVLVAKLNDAEIPDELAQRFLSEVATAITHIIKNTKIDELNESLLSGSATQLVVLIDVEVIASVLDLSAERVNTALHTIAPDVAQILQLKSNDIIEYAASLSFKGY